MNKKIIIPIAAIALIGTSILGINKVSAQDLSSGRTSIIKKIALKFNLKEADVQIVFDEQKTDRQIEMQADFEKNLSEKVEDGSLTEVQKQLIVAKHNEIKIQHDSNEPGRKQNMTDEERIAEKEAHQAEKTELENWAKENGINMEDLVRGEKGGGRMGEKGVGRMGGKINK
jgi:hypothetical protein